MAKEELLMEAMRRWLEHSRRGDALPESRDTTAKRIENFVQYAGKKERCTIGDVRRYLSALAARGTTGNYRKSTFYLLKSFFRVNGWPWTPGECKLAWQLRPDLYPDGPEEGLTKYDLPKASPPRREYLTPEEATRLLDATGRNPTLHMALRLAAVLGIRRVELTLLQRSEYRRPRIYVHTVKGGKSGWRTLDEETCTMLDHYLEIRRGPTDALLVDDDGAAIATHYLKNALIKLLDALELHRPHLGWHSIRRGICTWLHKRKVTETEITRLIGWKTPTMVHEYIQLDRDETEAKARKAHPLIKEDE